VLTVCVFLDQRVGSEDLLDRGSAERGGEVGAVFESGEDGYVASINQLRRTLPDRIPLTALVARDIDVGVEFSLGI